jgi:hypothetical protein
MSAQIDFHLLGNEKNKLLEARGIPESCMHVGLEAEGWYKVLWNHRITDSQSPLISLTREL